MPAFTTTRLYLDRGDPAAAECVAFHHPQIDETFRARQVNSRNFELSGGGPPGRIVEQVLGARKLVGFVDAPAPEPMAELAHRAQQAGLATRFEPYTFSSGGRCVFLSVAMCGLIGDLIDLDALAADYRAYFKDADPDSGEAAAAELSRLARRRPADFLQFADVEVHGDALFPDLPLTADAPHHPAGEYARCGLLLGYPVASTVAIIGTRLRLPGFSSR